MRARWFRASRESVLLTNHALVLVCVAQRPQATLVEIADWVGVEERSVQRLIADLEDAGCLDRVREGRRNTYTVLREKPLGRTQLAGTVGVLLDAITPSPRPPV